MLDVQGADINSSGLADSSLGELAPSGENEQLEQRQNEDDLDACGEQDPEGLIRLYGLEEEPLEDSSFDEDIEAASEVSTQATVSFTTTYKNTNPYSDITYTLYDNGYLYVTGSGVIPHYREIVDFSTIKANTEHIVIGDGITSIDQYGLHYIVNLSSVTIPDSVQSIGFHALSYAANLSSVDLGHGVRTIGGSAFESCGLRTLTLPESVTTIGSCAFSWNYYLNEVRCEALEPPVINDAFISAGSSVGKAMLQVPTQSLEAYKKAQYYNTSFRSISALVYTGTLGSFNWTLSNGELSITGSGDMPNVTPGSEPWLSYKDKITSVRIGDNVTSVAANAFKGLTNLTRATLPTSVTSIGTGAFQSSNLTSITFNSIQAPSIMPEGASPRDIFTSPINQALKINVPPASTTYIDNEDKTGWPEDNIVKESGTSNGITWTLFGSGKLSISGTGPMSSSGGVPWASVASSITSIQIEPGITSICDNAFAGCTQVESITLSDGITSIGVNAFKDCANLALTNLPEGLRSIGDSAFKNCTSLTLSDLPTNLTSIGNSAFEGCSGISGNLDLSQLTTLGERAFAGCTKLTSATFSSSLNTIGEAAFEGASALQSVTINKSQAPTVTSAAGTQNPASTLFDGTQATIKVPYGTTGTTDYDANGWELERLRLSGVTYYDETGVEKIVPESEGVRVLEAYKDTQSPTLSSGWYVLNGAIGGDITFDERINVSGDVKIILSSSTLNVPKGIDVPKGSTLTVYSKQQNSPFGTIEAGVLSGTGSGSTDGVEPGSAAIGGSFGQDTGTINIVGGIVNAIGGTGAAGIGGAQGGSLGTINVKGGTVSATGGAGACGIGAGASASSSGAGGTINVTGGSVNATGTDAPGIGAPKGSSGALTLNVTDTGHVVAANTGGGVVVGSADAPQDVEMNIGGIIVAETGDAKSPSRDDIGCDKPTLETSGVVLVVESVRDIEENANKSITINEHSVLLINGYEDGVEVFPNPESGQTSQKVTLTPGADSSHSIDLEPGGSLVFTNSDNKKIVITAPNTPNTTGTTNTTINLASDNQVSLPKGVTVSIEGKKLPFIVDTQQSLTLKNFGTVSDDTPVNNPQNPLEVGFDQLVSDIVAPENKVLSEEDARRYEYGFGTSVWLEVKYEVLDADKTQVEENLGASKLGQLLDISLFYKVDGRAQTQIHETATPVQVKFNIPEALLAYDPAKVKRTFKIVRVHSAVTGEKEVATLDTFDGASVVDGIATFASNKFSAFALLYEDEAIPEPVVPGENNNPAAGGSTGTGSGTEVGDSTGTGSNASASNGSGTSGTDTSNGTSQSKGATNTESGSLFSDTGDNAPVVPLTMLLLMAVGLMGAYVYRLSTFAIKRRAKHSR